MSEEEIIAWLEERNIYPTRFSCLDPTCVFESIPKLGKPSSVKSLGNGMLRDGLWLTQCPRCKTVKVVNQ